MTDNVKVLGWLLTAFILVIFHSCIDQKTTTAQTKWAEYSNPQPVKTNESVVVTLKVNHQAEQLILQQQQQRLLKDYEELQSRLESAQ